MNMQWSRDDRAARSIDPRRTCILVLGTHRSGTSALTRALNLLGAALPKHLMAPNPGNERGYWEPMRLVALHDVMLAEAGSHWDDWRGFDPATLGPDRVAHFRREVIRIINEEYGDAPLFIVKDPRICRMIALWRDALGEIGAAARFAIPLRHPLETARSLERRNGFPLPHGCLMWLRDVLAAEHGTRGAPRVFVPFRDLLDDPPATAARVAAQLAPDWPCVPAGAERIASEIDPAHCHHVAGNAELHEPIAFAPWLRETWDACAALARDPADPAAQQRLDRVRDELDCATASFAQLMAAREAELTERDRRIVTLDQTLVERDAAVRRVAALDRTVALRDSALGERNKRIAALEAALAACHAEAAALQASLAHSEARLTSVYASTSWRIAAPLRAAKRLLQGLGLSR